MEAGERILENEAATAALGARLAALLAPGDLVALSGPLGAGKSVLARALIRALTTPEEEAPSPTFTLVQVYEGPRLTVAHLDLYRLRGPEEAEELGVEDLLAEGAVVIEWPERLGGALPPDRLEVRLEPADADTPADGGDAPRLARLRGLGAWSGRVAPLLRP